MDTINWLDGDWLDIVAPWLAIGLLVSSFVLMGVLIWRGNRRSR